jgi:hypothetical protein
MMCCAGAGKTNTPEFGAGSQTFNRLFGTTVNPWNTSKTVGGSSGGSAAALAVGQVRSALWHSIASGVLHEEVLRAEASQLCLAPLLALQCTLCVSYSCATTNLPCCERIQCMSVGHVVAGVAGNRHGPRWLAAQPGCLLWHCGHALQRWPRTRGAAPCGPAAGQVPALLAPAECVWPHGVQHTGLGSGARCCGGVPPPRPAVSAVLLAYNCSSCMLSVFHTAQPCSTTPVRGMTASSLSDAGRTAASCLPCARLSRLVMCPSRQVAARPC